MTTEETGAFIIWLLLVIVAVVVLDSGLVAGIGMSVAGILMGLVAVRRRRADGHT